MPEGQQDEHIVQLPDGNKIGIPKNVPPEQFDSYIADYQKNAPKPTPQAVQVQPQPNPNRLGPDNRGLLQRVNDWWTRKTAPFEGTLDNPGRSPQQKATDLGKGVTAASLPLIGGGLVSAPVATAIGVAGGTAGNYLGKKLGGYVGGKLGAPDLGEDVGGLTGTLAGGAGGGKLGGLVSDALPSASLASKNFQDVMSKAKDITIDPSAPYESALRARELAKSGGREPKVTADFIRRMEQKSTDAKPAEGITYEKARDFYTNASQLSADEKQTLKPVMKRQVGQFTRDLGGSIEEAADKAGVGDQYRSAMTEYRRAMKLQGFTENAADLAWKAALGYLGVTGIQKLLNTRH